MVEDEPDIDKVIGHSLLNEALRSEFTPLISFLEADPVIDRLASWCFKQSFTEKPEFNKMSRIALKLFTSVIPRVFEIFLYSNRLAMRLHEFLQGDDSKNPLLCGFFTRIMTQQIRWGGRGCLRCTMTLEH